MYVDYSDASIEVDFLCENGQISHSHINPIYLEKQICIDSNNEMEMLMDCAGALMRGEASLESFVYMYEKIRKV